MRVVLEDVALDAVWRDGRLVAATSARLVAEHLGIDPGTVASALRVLRERGVVELAQSTGPGGRFGLAVYTVHLPAGIEVIGSPRTARPNTVAPDAVDADATTSAVPARDTPPRRGEQGALDFGSVTG